MPTGASTTSALSWEVVEIGFLGGREELRAGVGDQIVDVLDRLSHDRRKLFPEGQGVPAALLIGLVPHQVEIGQLDDGLRRGEQQARHALTQLLIELLGHLQQTALGGQGGLVVQGEHRLELLGHRMNSSIRSVSRGTPPAL